MAMRDTNKYKVHGRERGFTLIELMITIAILGILVTIAAPNFRTLMINQQIRAAAQELHGSLLFARAEAVKLNTSVRVTREGGGWDEGWRVRALDAGGNETGNVLRQQDAFENVAISEQGNATTVTFNRAGRSTGGSVQFDICITDGTQRSVMIDAGGMARVERGGICP